jgi:RHS repeat-associated protein
MTRILSLVAAFLIACASTGAHGYARPLQPETAHRGFATAVQGAPRDQSNVTPEAASENSRAIVEASDGRRFYAKARYYGAGRGSFISVDPWDGDTNTPVSLNKYLYGYANPGVYVDPDGRITLLVDLQRWFDQQSANSLAVARNFDAAQAGAPLYARPGLAVGYAASGIAYLTGAAASGVVAGANAAANAVVVAADEAGAALNSENAFAPLAIEARAEFGAFVERTRPAVAALKADPIGVGAAATAGLMTGYADQINRAAAGDAQAQFDLAAELHPRRFGERVEGAVLRAADDVKVGAPRPVAIGEGAGGEPALQMAQRPGKQPAAPLEAGPYGDLAARSARDDMSPDHIPSYAARRAALQQQLGRELSRSEERQLRNEATCLMVPTCIHREASRTYGGRNTPQQIAEDAKDLPGAQERDLAAYRERLVQEGHSEDQIQDAFQNVRQRNRRSGIE